MQINSKMNGVICKLLVIGIFIAISSFTLFAQTSGTIKGAGSGFIVDPEGYILTNYHVIEGAETITVYMDGRAYQPTVVATAEASDLALLKIPASGLTPVVLGNSLLVQLLDPVVAMGYPLPQYGRDLSVSEGKITAIRTNVEGREGRDTLQHDAVITHGSSGGPLFNMKGEVIGVNFGGVEGSGLQFAIPVNEAVPLLRNIPNFNPANMGTATQTLTPQEILSRYRPSVVYIETVTHFSWFELLPDPQSIEGFTQMWPCDPFVYCPDPLGSLVSRLDGLGLRVVGDAGFGGTIEVSAGSSHAGIILLAFESREQAQRAVSVLLQQESSEYKWKINLGEGPLTMEGLLGEFRLIAFSESDNLSCSVNLDGRIALKLSNILLYITMFWQDVPGPGEPCSLVSWRYQDGYIVKITETLAFPNPTITEERVISVEEVAGKLQYLARLVATTVRNKLGSSDD